MDTTPLDRRQLLTYALLGALARADAWASGPRPIARAWVRSLRELCRDLHGAALKPAQWQEQVEALIDRVPLEELLRDSDFERCAKVLSLPEDRAGSEEAALPQVQGFEPSEVLTRVFGMRAGRAIVPHGHHNIASMHLVVRGAIHVRHYQRVAEDEDHLVLRPTIDRISRPGGHTSISDDRDNVHWLVATEGPAYTLDVVVAAVVRERESGRDYVDPLAARPDQDGLLRAPRLSAGEAIRRYGAAS